MNSFERFADYALHAPQRASVSDGIPNEGPREPEESLPNVLCGGFYAKNSKSKYRSEKLAKILVCASGECGIAMLLMVVVMELVTTFSSFMTVRFNQNFFHSSGQNAFSE